MNTKIIHPVDFWTAQRVKDELPRVDVLLNGKLLPGRVLGRMNRFATVHFGNHMYFEWAWDTIASCLNRRVPLRTL